MVKIFFCPIPAEYNGWWVQKKKRKFTVTYKGTISKYLNPKNIQSLKKSKQTNQENKHHH